MATPVVVASPANVSEWMSVSVGDGTTCALDQVWDAWCWGITSPPYGANTNLTPAHVELPSGITQWWKLKVQGYSICGIGKNSNQWFEGPTFCWGELWDAGRPRAAVLLWRGGMPEPYLCGGTGGEGYRRPPRGRHPRIWRPKESRIILRM